MYTASDQHIRPRWSGHWTFTEKTTAWRGHHHCVDNVNISTSYFKRTKFLVFFEYFFPAYYDLGYNFSGLCCHLHWAVSVRHYLLFTDVSVNNNSVGRGKEDNGSEGWEEEEICINERAPGSANKQGAGEQHVQGLLNNKLNHWHYIIIDHLNNFSKIPNQPCANPNVKFILFYSVLTQRL